ncbi:MAG: hypothetical protein PHC62_00950 [Candidatus Izemoplasmatales bacterium]|nr:hypothetical protein [Candidatus Izemoplasmatales bacterium]
MAKKVFDINPFTGKKDKPYQVEGKKVDVKYVYLNEPGIPKNTYVISSKGEVWKKAKDRNGEDVVEKLKITILKTGYRVFYIRDTTGDRLKLLCHRYVAKYFVKQTKDDIKNERFIVVFKDGKKARIVPENLVWTSRAEVMNEWVHKK